jgi:hypothetical protein
MEKEVASVLVACSIKDTTTSALCTSHFNVSFQQRRTCALFHVHTFFVHPNVFSWLTYARGDACSPARGMEVVSHTVAS